MTSSPRRPPSGWLDRRRSRRRLRPATLDEVVGQEHLLGRGRPLRRLIEADRLSSVIFWGPPGTGQDDARAAHRRRDDERVRAALRGQRRR